MSHKTEKSVQTNPYAIAQYQSAQAQLGNSQYKPLTGDQIGQYQSPYQSQVIDAFNTSNNQSRQMALNGNTDQAIAQHAFGGTGRNVENALTNGQYDINSANFTSNLLNQGYGQALGVAQSENAAQNQYPLAIQQLLGQLAGQTQQNRKTTQDSVDITDIGKAVKTGAQIAALFAGG